MTAGGEPHGRPDQSRPDQTVMLLTQTLGGYGDGEARPITGARLAELEIEAERAGHDLGVYATPSGLGLIETAEDGDQIRRLLERGYTLGRRTEQWEQQGISFICRTNPAYPARLLRRMGKESSPPTLYCMGSTALLDTIQTAMVLPPTTTSDMNKFAERLGKAAQLLGSTAATGADTRAERTLLANATGQDSAAVGVVRGGLLKASTNKEFKQGLANGRLLLISAASQEREDITDEEAVTGSIIVHALAGRTILVRPSSPPTWIWADLVEMPTRENESGKEREPEATEEEAAAVEADARATQSIGGVYEPEGPEEESDE